MLLLTSRVPSEAEVGEKDIHVGSRWNFLKPALGKLASAAAPMPPESSHEVSTRC